MACLIRDEPESLISGTLNKVNTMRNLLNQVTGGSQLTNSCTSDMSTELSSMATFDIMAKRHCFRRKFCVALREVPEDLLKA